MIDKSIVRKHFDRHASEYDRYAVVQKEMADKLLARLSACFNGLPGKDDPLRVLEIGCGTGYLTEKLAQLWPKAEIVAVDISEAMVNQAQKRLGRTLDRCRFIVDDAERWARDEEQGDGGLHHQFDIMVSNATFQWFVEPEQTVSRLLNRLRSGGFFAFSTFGPRTFHELHESFRMAEAELGLPHLPHGQTFVTPDEWQRWLTAQATVRASEAYEHVMTYASVREFLDHVKRIGAGNANKGRSHTAGVNRALFRLMYERYRERFGDDKGIFATYDVLLYVCEK